MNKEFGIGLEYQTMMIFKIELCRINLIFHILMPLEKFFLLE